jgi:hypothetical protein
MCIVQLLCFILHQVIQCDVQDVLLKAPRLDTPNKACGWFTRATIQQVRDMMRQHCERVFGQNRAINAYSKYLMCTILTACRSL